MNDTATKIIECIKIDCQQKLRIPVMLNALRVTCPKCNSKWINFPYKIVNLIQGTTVWHNWRAKGIGASDAPAIMGENPWKSRERLLKEKLEGLNFEPNKAMRRGTALEPIARSRYEQLTGIQTRPVCLESMQFEWLKASIDGLTHDGSSVVEIKCGESVYKHVSSQRQVPGYYFGQLQHILAVTGLARIDFWCYLPDRPEVHLRVARDNYYIDRLIKTETKFWEELNRRGGRS